MKRVSVLTIFCIPLYAHAQLKTTLIGDSIHIHSNAGTGELILQNSTQGVPGFLYNKGEGRTEFRKGLIKLNGSQYIIGGDTLSVPAADPNGLIRNQNSYAQPANFNINGNGSAQDFYSNTATTSNLYAGYYWNAYSLKVEANSPTGSVVITPNTFATRPALFIGPGGYEPALTVGASWGYPTDHTIGIYYNKVFNNGLQWKNVSAFKMYWDVRGQNEAWPWMNIYKGYHAEMHTGNTRAIGYYANITSADGFNYALFADSGKVFIREKLTTEGALEVKRTVATSSLTLDETHYYIAADAASTGISLTLPPAASCNGRVYIVKKIDSSLHTVTITPNGSEAIDGASTRQISAQYQKLTLISSGSGWELL